MPDRNHAERPCRPHAIQRAKLKPSTCSIHWDHAAPLRALQALSTTTAPISAQTFAHQRTHAAQAHESESMSASGSASG